MNNLFFLIGIIALSPLVLQEVLAIELPHFANVATNNQSSQNEGTFINVTGFNILSGNFTAGREYLLILNMEWNNDHVTHKAQMQLKAGADTFHDAPGGSIVDEVSDTSWYNWQFFTVWNATEGDDVYVRAWAASNALFTVGQRSLIAIELSEELEKDVDYFYNRNTTDILLDTSWLSSTNNTATISFTPTVESDWLVMSQTLFDVNGAAVNHVHRLNSSGTYNEIEPLSSHEGEDPAEFQMHFVSRTFTDLQPGVQQNFTGQSRIDGTAFTASKVDARIFALNLTALDSYVSVWSEDEISIDGVAPYTQEVMTANLQTRHASDFVTIASLTKDSITGADRIAYRHQVDEVDSPTGQTANEHNKGGSHDSTDQLPQVFMGFNSFEQEVLIKLDTDAHLLVGNPNPYEDFSLTSFALRTFEVLPLNAINITLNIPKVFGDIGTCPDRFHLIGFDANGTAVCDGNAWVLFGEESANCDSTEGFIVAVEWGALTANEECQVDWGNGLGAEAATNLGLYIPFDWTLTAWGFAQDVNPGCVGNGWHVGLSHSNSNETSNNGYDLNFQIIAQNVTGTDINVKDSSFNFTGDNYLIFGIINDCDAPEVIDDWNMILYGKWR